MKEGSRAAWRQVRGLSDNLSCRRGYAWRGAYRPTWHRSRHTHRQEWVSTIPTADDGIELKGNVIGLQRFQHQVLAEFELVDDAGKLGKLLHRMPDVEYQTGSFILIDSNFVEVEPGFTASISLITIYKLRTTNY